MLNADEIKQMMLDGKIYFFSGRTERFMNGTATDKEIETVNYCIEQSKPK